MIHSENRLYSGELVLNLNKVRKLGEGKSTDVVCATKIHRCFTRVLPMAVLVAKVPLLVKGCVEARTFVQKNDGGTVLAVTIQIFALPLPHPMRLRPLGLQVDLGDPERKKEKRKRH